MAISLCAPEYTSETEIRDQQIQAVEFVRTIIERLEELIGRLFALAHIVAPA
jgi:hypothetical protein